LLYGKDIYIETLAKRYKSCNIVIPRLDRGIQCFQGLSGFPRIRHGAGSIKSGMTEKGLIQRVSHDFVLISPRGINGQQIHI
jgi:hypothetical protein